MKTKPLIRQARRSDVIDMNGKYYKESFSGYAVELDGKVIGIAGLLHSNPAQVVSDMKDEMRKYPKTIIRMARIIRDMITETPYPVYATPSPYESNARRMLEYVGFKPFLKGIYKWDK